MKRICLIVLLPFVFSASQGQERLKTYHIKRGEVLDVVLLTPAPHSEVLFDHYKKTAFPVAFEYGYQPQPGFTVTDLTLGNHRPSSFVLGKWPSKGKRQGFLTDITQRVPDFHQQRRELFTYFGLTYYVMDRDLHFSIDTSKHNVVTALWQHDLADFTTFFAQWKGRIAFMGGEVIVQLRNGKSPVGYHYDPDRLLIVQWEDETAFQRFAKQYPLDTYEALKNVHEFVIN